MNKWLQRLSSFEDYFLVVLLPAMCALVFYATFCRYFNFFIIPWAEELARYMMIWILFFGASAAAKRGEHFCVTALTASLPIRFQKALSIIRMILMIAFTLFVSRFCIVILRNQMMMKQVSPSLHWPMWTMYSAILIGSVLMMIRYIIRGIRELRVEGKKE
jgi:C4-dicarboxylate transporter DctQ subunit